MQILEQMAEFSNTATKSFYDFNKLVNQITQQYTKESYEIANDFINTTMKQANKLSEVKKIEDFIHLQGEFAAETGNKVLKSTQKTLNTVLDNFNEVNKWFGEATSHTLHKTNHTAKDKK